MAKKVRLTRKDIKKEDEFLHLVKESAAALFRYWKYAAALLGGLALVLIIYVIATAILAGRRHGASAALAEAEGAFNAPVVTAAELAENPVIEQLYKDVYTSDEDRLREAGERFAKVASEYDRTPQGRLAQYYRAVTAHQTANCAEAEAAYRAFLENARADDPLWSLAWNGIAYCAESVGELDKAVEAFGKAADNDTNPAAQRVAFLGAARIAEARSEFTAAIDNLASYLRVAGEAPDRSALERRIESLKRKVAS
ncbi:hypothetical protein K8I61_20040 [bacterium]|nr:hypothetical protein [bacterium]